MILAITLNSGVTHTYDMDTEVARVVISDYIPSVTSPPGQRELFKSVWPSEQAAACKPANEGLNPSALSNI